MKTWESCITMIQCNPFTGELDGKGGKPCVWNKVDASV